MNSPICAFCYAKAYSTLARILDLARLAARSASDRGLPFGFLRWIRLTRPWAAGQASLVFDRTAPLATKPQWSALLHQGMPDLMQKEPIFLIKVGPKKGPCSNDAEFLIATG